MGNWVEINCFKYAKQMTHEMLALYTIRYDTAANYEIGGGGISRCRNFRDFCGDSQKIVQ